MMQTTTRDKLHHLVDELPDSELGTAERILQALRDTAGDSFLRYLQRAPIDDEPETPEEAAAVAEAYNDIAAGRLLSHTGVRRRLLDEP